MSTQGSQDTVSYGTDRVDALVGYDQDNNLRIVEADGWFEQGVAFAADPVRVRICVPPTARPECRSKKEPVVINLAGIPELTEPSSL
jgi:hypothetical protein